MATFTPPEPTPAATPPHLECLTRPEGCKAGTWGEHHGPDPVSVSRGLHQFEQLARETSRLTEADRTRPRRPSVLQFARTLTSIPQITIPQAEAKKEPAPPGEQGTFGEVKERPEEPEEAVQKAASEGFDLREWLENRMAAEDSRGIPRKRVGLLWTDLSVFAPGGSSAVFVKTLPRAILGTFGIDLAYIAAGIFQGLAKMNGKPDLTGMKQIIGGHEGVLRPGEMLLVLGRPGSGSSTFLQAVTSSLPDSLTLDPAASISYGGLNPGEITRKMRGEVVYSGEDDLHYPHLTVADTLKFALRNKVPSIQKRLSGETRKQFITKCVDVLLNMFGISHIKHTIVGDSYVRGVSGGERKRVSIAEALVTRAAVFAWDNSTRGLDASTALDYARSLKLLTKLQRTSATLATLYQVSETIYECFDRVLVMDEGLGIFYGSVSLARQYFQDLGYYAPERQTTADFITSITDPNEVRFRQGFEKRAPRTAVEREKAWKSSELYKQLKDEMAQYSCEVIKTGASDANELKRSVRSDKNKGVNKGSNYTVSFLEQVKACASRQLLVKWGQREDQYVKLFTIISISLMISSLFFNESNETMGVYSRGGIMLFAALFNGWLQLSESIEAVSGRIIIQKHKTFGFHRPSAMVIARALTDIPLLLIQCFLSSIIMYFMANLKRDAGAFFIFYLYTFLSAYNLTALYRLLSALSPTFNEAIRFSVLALNVIIVFVGYVIHRPQMNWMKFLSYINGVSYVFEGYLVNEFTYDIQCSPGQIVPFNEARNATYQSCSLAGNKPGSLSVEGSDYLRASFGYSHTHLWRNVGVVIAFSALYIIPTVIASELLPFAGGGGGTTVFAPTKKAKQAVRQSETRKEDPEANAVKGTTAGNQLDLASTPPSVSDRTAQTSDSDDEKRTPPDLEHKPIFTWKDLNYTVNGRHILNNVCGYVKPGEMTALMGASGAGKTTLLTTLSQRQTSGTVTGEMLVDGKPLNSGFQKGTGFVQQQDNHLPTQTVREAIEFSALLRQPREVSKAQKMGDVDYIINLLELDDLQDAIIGVPGAGLGVERRKRVTIAVELAAKPDLLLFLDEPTSGLDSAGAASIVRLLRKLTNEGQAILCTIHQPSALLFESFDNLLLLSPGGNTAYFGRIGEKSGRNSNLVRTYFEQNGAPPCPPSANVAEYVLELTAGDRSGKVKWGSRWLSSIQAADARQAIEGIVSDRSKRPVNHDPREEREFSTTLFTQITLTTQRLFVDMYRDAAYPYGVLFSNIIVGLVLGLAFQHLGNSITDLQNRVFTTFIIFLNFPAVVNAISAKFFLVRELFENREGPSKTFSWVAMITSFILTSLPIGVVSAVIYFLPSFFISNYARSTPVSGYVFFLILLFNWFEILFSFALASVSPTPTAAANILPFLIALMSLVNGIVVPHTQMPNPWRDFVYWVNPLVNYTGGFVGTTLHGLQVECRPVDLAVFNPPSGQTCLAYAGEWVAASGGYLTNPNATSDCGFCQYSNGDQYLKTLDIRYTDRWRDLGIFLAFTSFNAFLAYACYYAFRVRKTSFLSSVVLKIRQAGKSN